MLSKKTHIKISTIISLVTIVCSILMHVFYTPFLLNKVGDSNYGLYTFSNSIITWFSISVNAIVIAYSKLASKQISIDKENGEKSINTLYNLLMLIFFVILIFCSSILILLLSTNTISINGYSNSEKKLLIMLLCIVTVKLSIGILTKTFTTNIKFHNKHIWVKASAFLVTALTPVICIPLLQAGKGIIAVAIVVCGLNIIASIADVLYDTLILKQKISLRYTKEIRKMVKPALLFCSILLINEIFYSLNLNTDIFILGLKGYSDLIALYNLALTIIVLAIDLTDLINMPFVPTIYENYYSNKHEENKNLFYKISMGQILIWSLITFGFVTVGQDFIKIWLGEDRMYVYFVAIALFLIYSIPAAKGPARELLYCKNKQKNWMLITSLTSASNFIVTYALVSLFGKNNALEACLTSTAVTTFAGWWLSANILYKINLDLNFKKYLTTLFKFMFIGFASFIMMSGIKAIVTSTVYIKPLFRFLIYGFSYTLLYSIICFALSKKDIIDLYKSIKSK